MTFMRLFLALFWRFCCSSNSACTVFTLKVTWVTVAAAALTDNAGNQLLGVKTGKMN